MRGGSNWARTTNTKGPQTRAFRWAILGSNQWRCLNLALGAPDAKLRLPRFVLGAVAGVGQQAALSVERDDDLAVGAALLDVGQRFGGLVERERLVDDRAEAAGVVEGGQFA